MMSLKVELKYVLWDLERSMWWGPNGWGYVHTCEQAGLYSKEEAVKIVMDAALSGSPGQAVAPVASYGDDGTKAAVR